MSNYILQRNKTIYYRRRIPKIYAKYFDNREEIRFKVSRKSRFQAMMSIEVLNSLYEELIMALQLDTSNRKPIIAEEYLEQMLRCINKPETPLPKYYTIPYYEDEIEEVDKQLTDKINSLKLSKKRELLENLDNLEKLIHIIDPKNNLQQGLQSQNINVQESPAPAKLSGVSLKELYELFLKNKKKDFTDISETTLRDYDSAYKDFLYVLGDVQDKDISLFIKDDFKLFANAIHSMPSSRTKKKIYRDLSYLELKELDIPDDHKMAVDTKKKKISTLRQIFDVALDPLNGYITENHVIPFIIKEAYGKRSSKVKRKKLSDANLSKLFNSKIYTTDLEKILSKKPEQYWIPILASYTGMRQNEICQLHVEDVKKECFINDAGEEETIWYFDINDKDDKHLKNEVSNRLMPLHPILIKLGFIEYFNSIKEKQPRLWANLELHPKEQRYNTNYAKSFMKFFRKYITEEKDQVFHSLRHNIADQLIKNTMRYKIPKDLVNKLMGHAEAKDMTTSVYSTGFEIRDFYEAIKTIEYSI